MTIAPIACGRASRVVVCVLLALFLLSRPSPARAQAAPSDLAAISLEDLMNIEITTASHKDQRVVDTPAAVFVLTHEDIRRSGLTTLPDVLRLVPGVDVAQVNANKWAVSIRGFNAFYADKLLVLIDGRSLYNRLFAGVLWDAETIMLDDIDRIEIVRGPGGAVWGANAVNGVINIVTKSAADTHGVLARAGGGSSELTSGAIRYGGRIGGASYRLFSDWSAHGDTTRPTGLATGDASRMLTNGGRLDWTSGADSLMVEGHGSFSREHALWTEPSALPTADATTALPGESQMSAGAINAQWERHPTGGSELQVQSWFDMSARHEPIGDYRRRAGSVEVRYHAAFGSRHDVVSGAGYQLLSDTFDGTHGYTLNNLHGESIVNMFAQDEIAVVRQRLALTIGGKLERATAAGWSVQPTVRTLWTLTSSQRIWTAVSRSVRTPSIIDRDMSIAFAPMASPAGLPLHMQYIGNPAAASESTDAVESGYRLALGRVQVDATAFTSEYRNLRTSEPLAPSVVVTPTGPEILAPVTPGYYLQGRSSGIELSAEWRPLAAWRLDGGYTAFRFTPHLDAASQDPIAGETDGDAPHHMVQARSRIDAWRGTEIDLFAARVGALEHMGVPAYTRLDARVAVKLSPRVSLALAGQNLLSAAQPEFVGSGSGPVATLVPRSADVRLVWRLP